MSETNQQVPAPEAPKTPATPVLNTHVIATDYVKAKGILSGFTQGQACAVSCKVVEEWLSLLATPGEPTRAEMILLYVALLPLSNPSAYRQVLEKAGVLAASAAGSKKLDPAAMAAAALAE